MGLKSSLGRVTTTARDDSRWSDKQRAIFAWFEQRRSQHLIVRARAGSGKTSSIIEGINRAPESTILLCAFSKWIATELAGRITNPRAEAKTLHAIGYQAIRANWGAVSVASGSTRGDDLTRRVIGKERPFQIARLVTNLHTKAREMMPLEPTLKDLVQLALFFDYVPDEGWTDYSVEWIAKAALQVMQLAATEEKPFLTGIDYADMIYQPLVRNWLSPHYDLVVVDEGQDMTMAQLTIAQRVCKREGRLCIVGDDKQCQPAGTMVRVGATENVPIESLAAGDTVETFDRHGQVFIKSGRVNATCRRFYEGDLLVVSAGDSKTRCTPSHKWLVRWDRSAGNTWITYLMRQGTRYRVGQCQLFRAKGKGVFGLSERARVERADEAWILRVHSTLEEALAYEQIVAAEYGLPEMIFHPSSGIKYFSQLVIDTVYDSLDTNIQERRAYECLREHGREMEFPIYRRANSFERRGRTTLFETQACNLLDGYMSIPVAPDAIRGHDKQDRHAVKWASVSIRTEPFSGFVYSLDINRYHKYVADGLVTCNSIYSFRGADSGALDRLKQELNADELPLNITYRCGKAIVREAQTLVPDIQAAETNGDGTVLHVEYDQMMKEVRPGDFILSRLNAPLVAITLRLLAKKVRAKMAGRDLGSGITAIIDKQKCNSHDKVETLLKKVQEWETKAVARYVAYGQQGLADRVRDQAGMIYALADGIELPESEGNRDLQVRDLVDTCAYLFEEPGDESKTHVICSSVHKAKGLETDRVWLLQESLYRRGESAEERNIDYVARTRAKQQLAYVTGVDSLK